MAEQNEKNTPVEEQRLEKEQIEDLGSVYRTKGPHAIHCLTVVGQIEGHVEAPQGQKTTKYEHVIPQLVDIEESFQLWRFRHMKTVERIIGYRRGTGGSSGVAFLKKALELTFFPELFEVRTVIEP